MKFPFQTWFWINRRILYIEISFSHIKLFNWENIGYVAYPPEALFWSLKEDKYIHCRWMTSFVYLRNLATSDIPISGFPGCCWWPQKASFIALMVSILRGCFASSFHFFYHYENTPIQIYWQFYHQKKSDIFLISAQNMDCGYSLEPPRRGGSNEYPQSMLLSRNKKNNAYPCKPQIYYIKVGFKGIEII